MDKALILPKPDLCTFAGKFCLHLIEFFKIFFCHSNFHVYESCIRQQLTKSEHARRLPEHCNERNAETVVNFIDTIQNSMISFMCGDYGDDSDQCAPMNKHKPPKGIGSKWHSFVLPLVEIMDEKSAK